jgi:hypothetical protein
VKSTVEYHSWREGGRPGCASKEKETCERLGHPPVSPLPEAYAEYEGAKAATEFLWHVGQALNDIGDYALKK